MYLVNKKGKDTANKNRTRSEKPPAFSSLPRYLYHLIKPERDIAPLFYYLDDGTIRIIRPANSLKFCVWRITLPGPVKQNLHCRHHVSDNFILHIKFLLLFLS